jgi:hypothetical protein
MRIIEIGATIFASARLSCTIHPEADRRVAMGMIRGAVDKTSSMKDIVLPGLRRIRSSPAIGRFLRPVTNVAIP